MKANHSTWRKLTAIAVAGLLLLGMAGCGGSNSSTAAEPTNAATESAGGAEVHTIGYSLNSMDSTMKTMADYFESVAKEHGWEPPVYLSLSQAERSMQRKTATIPMLPVITTKQVWHRLLT